MAPFKNFDGKNPSLYRSGSAPPTVERSLSLAAELNSSRIDSNPDYLSCYYNSIARNPRMPPSIFSKEDWRSRQRLGHDVNHYSDTRLPLSPNNSCHTSTGMAFVDSDNTVAALRRLNLWNDVSDISAHSSNSSLLGSSSSSNFPTHASNSSRLSSDFTPTRNLPFLLRNSINASSSVALSYPRYVEYLKMFEYANSSGQSSLDTLWMREYASQFYGNNGYNFNLYYPLKPVKHIDGLNGFPYRLRDKFNINKTECDLALSDIAGYVVDFSMNQLGSRFIQQKLETASVEEINMLFKEVMPQALSLTTDVFGNHVIQKVFEHGSSQQIRELTSKLYSNVLYLSLQIHGCRVIQKAIEVVDLDQKVKMAAELDGYIMRCVQDQNGNHVIQKCIEFIPEKAIQFVISFLCDNIITLSTHKYGCRIILRVLKHCNDPNTHKIIVDEVMKCVCMLAWDQYGNYIVQHAVEHGKPDVRSAIVKQLIGQLVRMSKHKHASNVVEKCLAFGSQEEREIMVDEMIGNTDDIGQLRVMMKDRFGNYVVQKILETCSDQQLQLVLSRIKAHLSVLKKYVYGKHVVARMKKLVAAAERRKVLQSANPLNRA